MYVRFAVIQATVIATAAVAFITFFAISDGGDHDIAAWAIPLAWALVYATLVFVSVYLVKNKPVSNSAFRIATVLSGIAIPVSFAGVIVVMGPVMVLTTFSTVILLTGIQHQRSLIEFS
ncbi:MAG: hypothetical protein HQ478_11365 [Chloroflexi bacterium]|nr:hypothetical protein [Chloroflexota bacterium]